MKAERRTAGDRNSLARGRALTRLIAVHRLRYRELYLREGRRQDQGRRALAFEYPEEYRALYLEEKQKLLDEEG